MATDKRKLTKRQKEIILYVVLAIIIIAFAVWYYYKYYYVVESINTPIILEVEDNTSGDSEAVDVDGILQVHMIDCGQAESFLFEQNGEYGLIDCGTRSTGKDVVKYLQDEGVKELQFVVGTHPHDDHMGGMYDVLNTFACNMVYMPDIEDGLVTTNWYMQLMQKISKDQIKLVNPKVDDEFHLGEAIFKVVGQLTPQEAGSNINNYSTVIKVSFGTMDLLMTGDAETRVETKMLETNEDELQCEILKLGHHGSNTSTSDSFLKAVDPDYGLISCEVGNKYQHPSTETVKKLKKFKIKIYRTDETGSVVLTISNDDVIFNKKAGDYKDGITVANSAIKTGGLSWN